MTAASPQPPPDENLTQMHLTLPDTTPQPPPVSDLECKECDRAKVIVVTEATGRERRYTAHDIGIDQGCALVLGKIAGTGLNRKLENLVVSYAPGHWTAVSEEDAIVGDLTARKLAIALRGLEAIAGRSESNGRRGREDAQGTLDEIAELDL